MLLISAGVLIYRSNQEDEDQQFLFENVTEVKSEIQNLDSIIKLNVDTLNTLLSSTRINSKTLNSLDSLTNLSIIQRESTLLKFNNTSKEIISLSEDISNVVSQNSNFSKFLIENEFGGKSFAIIRPIEFNRTNYLLKNKIQLEIINIGSIGLKNVRVEIKNLSKNRICQDTIRPGKYWSEDKMNCFESSTHVYHLGNLYVNNNSKSIEENDSLFDSSKHFISNNKIIHTVEITTGQKNLSLRINIESNNGMTTQLLDLVNLKSFNDSFSHCTQVIAYNPARLLYSSSPNYPQKAYEKFFEFDNIYQVINPRASFE